eukprot:scaffold246911_cov33-Tisochrysis_lutea.AAC.2
MNCTCVSSAELITLLGFKSPWPYITGRSSASTHRRIRSTAPLISTTEIPGGRLSGARSIRSSIRAMKRHSAIGSSVRATLGLSPKEI